MTLRAINPRLRSVPATQHQRSMDVTCRMSWVSLSNVRSAPTDFSCARGATGRSSNPRAAMYNPRALMADPVACSSDSMLIFAKSATESTPHAFSRFSKDGPMPGMPRNGIICTNSACLATGIMSMPSGLALVEAILATSLFAAMPTEQVMWYRLAT